MNSAEISDNLSRTLLYKMILIRSFENFLSKLKLDGKIYGMVHCDTGQEAVAVGICSALKRTDYIISTHRPHGHAIAKGVPINQIMAEIMGKTTGTNHGKGGSMHICDLEHGLVTSTGIVGSGMPVACGAAFASKYLKTQNVTCVFLGDGAANEGTFYESLNLAAIWKLPIIFVLENNGLAVTTLTKNTSSCRDYTKLASALGMKAVSVDGQDVEAVYKCAQEIIEYTRTQSFPALIQANTIRFNEHAEGDWYLKIRETHYRDIDEHTKNLRENCPIKNYEDILEKRKVINNLDVKNIWDNTDEEVKKSFEFAMNSPDPNPEDAYTNVYVETN